MTPSSPGPGAHDGAFALALLAAVLLTLAAVQVRDAHRWATAKVATISDYYTPNPSKEPQP
jgi:hypothetical protein